MNPHDRISKLQMVTVARGATRGEELNAQRAIKKLLNRLETVTLNDDATAFVIPKQYRSRFAEWRQRKYGVQVPLTDNSAEIIQDLPVEVDAEARAAIRSLVTQHAAYALAAKKVADFKINGNLPNCAHLELHEEYPLFKYQRLPLYLMQMLPAYALFMEQGTGKTPICVADMCNSIKCWTDPSSYRSIIVVPKALRLNWEREIEKFRTQDIETFVLRGGKTKRIETLIAALRSHSAGVAVIVTYDLIRQMWDVLQNVPWHAGYFDECHYAKSTKSKRTKHALMLARKCEKVIVATGTPVANTHLDLFAQFELMGEGLSGFSNESAFRAFYGVFDTQLRQEGIQKLVGVQNMPFMKERLAKLSYQVTKAEVLTDLPPKTYDIVEVDMTAAQKTAYRQMGKEILEFVESDKKVTANHVLTMMLRLTQITSGFVKTDAEYNDEGECLVESEMYLFEDNPKLDALEELVKDKTPNQKTIIWALFKQDIKAIMERLGDSAVQFSGSVSEKDRAEAVRRFNEDPTCKFFVGNPAAGGVGLNLLGFPPERGDEYTTNCDHEIYYSQGWSLIHRSQSEDRAHRSGTRVQVRITDLCVPDTIDQTIRERVVEKRLAANEVRDVHAILKEALGL